MQYIYIFHVQLLCRLWGLVANIEILLRMLWKHSCSTNQSYLTNGTFVLPTCHCEYSGYFSTSGKNCRKVTALLTSAPAVRDCMYAVLRCLSAAHTSNSCMLQKHGAPGPLLPQVLHWCFPQALQILTLTSHSVNGSDLIIPGLILEVSGTACILLNDKFILCIEQLEHAVHIMAVYLGWCTEIV